MLTATYGTTKYCSFFIANKPCPKPSCLFLHEMASESNTLNRYGLPMNKHVQPEHSLLDKLKIQVVLGNTGTVLPMATIVRDRGKSECGTVMKPTVRHLRFYSINCKGRYGFLEESHEDPMAIPDYCVKLSYSASPSKRSAELYGGEIEEIMSPGSPDRWVVDLMHVWQRDEKSVIVTSKSP